jgi:hypothetical protein
MDGAAQVLIGATAVVAVCMALAGARPESPSGRLRVAMESYQAQQWPEAYEALAALADDGNASAARVAAMMARQGPKLFGQRFDVSPERLARWERTMRGDTVAASDFAPARLAHANGPGTPARGRAAAAVDAAGPVKVVQVVQVARAH